MGQVYERFIAALPFGSMTAPVELRYLHHEEKIDTTFAGVRFHNMLKDVPGIARFQLVQRERECLDLSIEEAAMDLGARPLKVFFLITIQMIGGCR